MASRFSDSKRPDPDRFADVLADVARKRPDALVVLSDPMFTRHSRHLVEATVRHRLPAMWEWRDFVEAGGLMAYGPRLDELSRRTATYVDRVLKGAKPGELPVEQATRFELAINLKTARALGVMPSSSDMSGLAFAVVRRRVVGCGRPRAETTADVPK